MIYLNLTISVIILYVNDLIALIKRQNLSDWIKKYAAQLYAAYKKITSNINSRGSPSLFFLPEGKGFLWVFAVHTSYSFIMGATLVLKLEDKGRNKPRKFIPLLIALQVLAFLPNLNIIIYFSESSVRFFKKLHLELLVVIYGKHRL